MPEISIIVPVYNAEKYLPKCIDSLLSQTLQEIEIILVNDGSTDLSLKVCEKYAKKDPRVKIISKNNEGVAKARYDGIQKASADFISFIDSDDYYEPEFCEKMLHCMLQTGADLVECGYYSVIEDSKIEHLTYSSDMKLNQELFHNIVVRGTIVNGSEAVVLWNKLYRKSIIEKKVADYGDNQLEDYVFNVQYYTMVERYTYIHQCLTNYRQVPMSLSRKCNPKAYEILQKAELIKEDCMKKMEMITDADKQDDALWFLNYTINFLHQYLLSDISHSNEFLHQILKDEMLRQKCEWIAQKDRLAKLIINRDIDKAIHLIKGQVELKKIRVLLSNLKHTILPK